MLYRVHCLKLNCFKVQTLGHEIMGRKRYILYVHPRQDTLGHTQLSAYWKATKQALASSELTRNDAVTIYPFHATLTRFFTLEDSEPHDEIELQQIVAVAQAAFAFVSSCSTDPLAAAAPVVERIEQYDRAPSFTALSLTSPKLSTAIRTLLSACPRLQSNTIDGLHITLANGIVSQTDFRKVQNAISSMLTPQAWADSWTVALWAVSKDDRGVDAWSIVATIA
eukprot:GILJ01014561.1.p1 GENE.GILJ01014561.1~~GILJ01014561.1.p1  ORF type:complete len:224 (+),score=15.43 GILJ01014561.1:122-793(+)